MVSIYPPTLSLYCAGLIAQNVKDVLTGLDDGLYTLLLVGVRSKLACPILNASSGKEKKRGGIESLGEFKGTHNGLLLTPKVFGSI